MPRRKQRRRNVIKPKGKRYNKKTKIHYSKKATVPTAKKITSYLLKTHKPLSKKPKIALSSSKHKAPTYTLGMKKDKRYQCKVKAHDRVREVNHFKAKAQGGGTRPQHKQEHKRSC
jgi:hypothetical protein